MHQLLITLHHSSVWKGIYRLHHDPLMRNKGYMRKIALRMILLGLLLVLGGISDLYRK